MVFASEPKGLNWPVTRILLVQSEPSFEINNTLQWHAVGAVTSFLLRWHLSEDEHLEIYCSRVYVGNSSYGLNTASQKLFSKNFSELTTSQAATVAAWSTAPSMFAKNQAALERRRDRVIKNLVSDL